MNEDLSIQQLKFIDGLLEGKNQTKAYIDAGYEVKDANVAGAAASRLLNNVKIQEEINKRLNDIKSRNKLRLYRISEAALLKLANILNEDDNIEIIKDKKKYVKNNYLLRIKADIIKDLLDRADLKLAEEHNINLNAKLESNLSEEEKNEIIRLAFESLANMSGKDKKKD